MTKKITCTINDKLMTLEVKPGETLLEILRGQLSLLGTKKGCGAGECGACTVLVDEEPINSCMYLASWVDGKTVLTIEGLTPKEGLTRLQQSFVDEGAIQCGFCTPGMVLAAHALLKENPHPSEEEIKFELAGNFCRCTGYQSIIRAVKKSSETA